MSMVKVWNDNVIDHVEKFKGKTLNIKSKSFIEMDYEEAVMYKGQFYPPKYDKGGIQTLESMKCIRVEEYKPGQKKETEVFKCMKCSHESNSAASLRAHIKSKHVESMVDEDAKSEIIEG